MEGLRVPLLKRVGGRVGGRDPLCSEAGTHFHPTPGASAGTASSRLRAVGLQALSTLGDSPGITWTRASHLGKSQL